MHERPANPDSGRQTSVTTGTIMHAKAAAGGWAAFLMATDSNGISALQLQNQLGLGPYRTAWMLCANCTAPLLQGTSSAGGELVHRVRKPASIIA
jgi:hypothetical protein